VLCTAVAAKPPRKPFNTNFVKTAGFDCRLSGVSAYRHFVYRQIRNQYYNKKTAVSEPITDRGLLL
ncbi:MAG: hypothetical protein K2G87_06205, partial [Oscillospiraceae bacterium]|nr:hypothetical protein [Oscillospiraceae bacterium]